MERLELKSWYENINKENLKDIEKFYGENAFFKDPFNELKGRVKILALFEHMFEKLEGPRFVFIDEVHTESQSFISWDFVFTRSGRKGKIHGSTHLKWSQGKIVMHRDYWDVGEELLLKIPMIRFFYKKLQKALSIDG